MKAQLAPEGWVRAIEVQGNVQGKSENGERAGGYREVEMWPRVNQAKLLTLRGNVHMQPARPEDTDRRGSLPTNALQLNFAGGKPGEQNPVQHAETLDRGTMEWSDTPTSQSKLSADKLAVDFGTAGKAKDLIAIGNVETERELKGQPTQTATASNGDAQLDPGRRMDADDLARKCALEGGRPQRRGAASRVRASGADDGADRAGGCRGTSSSETRATKITFHQATGEIEAEGNVRSTDLGGKKGSHPAELAAAANIIADHMEGNSKTGRALVHRATRGCGKGHRCWRRIPSNCCEMPRVLNAVGNVRAVFPKQGNDAKSKPTDAAKQRRRSGMSRRER